jgi:hypothetical protein
MSRSTYCQVDWKGTGALRPRAARARDFVNFRGGKFMHCAREARPREFDSLPSLDPDCGRCGPYISAGSTKILIFDDPAELYQRGRNVRSFVSPNSTVY